MAIGYTFGFTTGKRNAEDDANNGADSKGPRTKGQALVTPEGVDVSEALEKLSLCCSNLDLRARSLEAATFITMEVMPNHPQLIAGMEGGKQHHEIVMKAGKEGWSKVQKKEIGGPALYVAFKWLENMGAKNETFSGIAKDELTQIFTLAKDMHFMDQVFSHSQAWLTKDKKAGYLRFKMQPWYTNLQLAFIQFIKSQGDAKIKGQTAPRGVKFIELEEVMEPIKGKGRGKGAGSSNDEPLY